METLPDPRHERYCQWLSTVRSERNPKTKTALADELGVNIRTLRDWDAKPEFAKELEKRVKFIVGSPERTKAVLDAMFEVATDPQRRDQVSAQKAYLEAVGYLQPNPKQVVGASNADDTSKLSIEELDKLISDRASAEREARGLRLVKEN